MLLTKRPADWQALAPISSIAPSRPKRQAWGVLALALLAAIMAGCARAPVSASALRLATPPPLNAPNAAEEAIPFLIAAEREAARRGDRAMLAQLWAVDALIIDGRGTTDPSDDYHWPGRAAILDRYVLAVFPNPPPPLDGVDALEIMVAGTEAVAVNGGDHWRFVHEDGRWWISELVYSRP